MNQPEPPPKQIDLTATAGSDGVTFELAMPFADRVRFDAILVSGAWSGAKIVVKFGIGTDSTGAMVFRALPTGEGGPIEITAAGLTKAYHVPCLPVMQVTLDTAQGAAGVVELWTCFSTTTIARLNKARPNASS